MATHNRVNSNFYQVGIEDANGNITGITVANVTATSSANLGSVSNITISGGNSGQFLSTNGSGVLSWASAATTDDCIVFAIALS